MKMLVCQFFTLKIKSYYFQRKQVKYVLFDKIENNNYHSSTSNSDVNLLKLILETLEKLNIFYQPQKKLYTVIASNLRSFVDETYLLLVVCRSELSRKAFQSDLQMERTF